mgnify:CR=1 FL=1
MLGDHFAEQGVELVDGLFAVGELGLRNRAVAVEAFDTDTPGFENELVARIEARDSLEGTSRRRHVEVGEVARERCEIGPALETRIDQQCLGFGGEGEQVAHSRGALRAAVEEGFDSAGISREEQALSATIEEPEGVHPLEVLEHRIAVFLVEMQQNFGVGRRAKAMAPLLEFGAQFLEVVDLTVEDDRERIVVAAHWLMTGSTQIEDREARVAEGEAVAPRAVGLDQQSAVIGTPVVQRQRGTTIEFVVPGSDASVDATHLEVSLHSRGATRRRFA